MMVLKFLTTLGSLVTTEELKDPFSYSVRIPKSCVQHKGTYVYINYIQF